MSNGTGSSGTSLDYERIPLLSIDFFMATTAAVGNSMLLLTIYKDPHRSLRSPSTKLVINMAVADFMAGSLSGYLLTAYDVTKLTNKPSYQDLAPILLRIYANIGIPSVIVSCCSVIAMAFDRWFAVGSAINYRNIVTTKRVNVLIVLFWIYALMFTSLLFTGIPFIIFEMVFCHLHVSLPLLVLPIVYWKTFGALEAHTRRMKNLESDSKPKNLKTAQREKKTTKAFVIVLCLFYVAFVPYVIAINLRNLCSVCAGTTALDVFLLISLRFVLLNCSFDPFVYALRIPKYRRAIRTVLNRCCCFRGQNNAINPVEATGMSLEDTRGQETTNTIQTIQT